VEAFGHHPEIGSDLDALRERFPEAAALSESEQSGVEGTSSDVLEKLVERNAAYKKAYGHIFIVCAAGKSGEEMLGLLEARMGNEPSNELRIAAGEQAKITRLRLMGLEG
jgi:2-oxo-4-hydroxy-4-carboxy-5-ureidoimidazoline decarboxylase